MLVVFVAIAAAFVAPVDAMLVVFVAIAAAFVAPVDAMLVVFVAIAAAFVAPVEAMFVTLVAMLVTFVAIAAALVVPVLATSAAKTPDMSYTALGVIALSIVPSVAESCNCIIPLAEVVAVKASNVVPFS